MNEPAPQEPKEPSVLDYLLSRLMPGRADKIELDTSEAPSAPAAAPALVTPSIANEIAADETNITVTPPTTNIEPEPRTINISFQVPQSIPWRTPIALLAALIGQFALDPTGFSFGIDTGGSLRETDFQGAALRGVVFYGIAILFLLWAYISREFQLPSLPDDGDATDPLTMRLALLGAGGGLSLLAFFAFSNNLFTVTNLTLWLIGLALYLRSLWLYERRSIGKNVYGESMYIQQPPTTIMGLVAKWWDVALFLLIALWGSTQSNIFLFGLVPLLIAVSIVWFRSPNAILTPMQNIKAFFTHGAWQVNVTRWGLLLVLVAGVIFFFRMYRIEGVPAEPFSDQAEKLLDVFDVTQGQTHIFFERNTGREFIQFYWTALMSFLFGTGLSFLSLKIGTALIGIFALPYIYLLGKEIGGPRVALFALILAGVAYWPNTISRIGLRFPLYPAFTAPTLYYLVMALRTQKRNHFIMAGLFLGLGLHGYSPFRFEPFVVIAAIAIYMLHKQAVGRRRQVLVMSAILVLTSFLVFMPLARYAIDHPNMFSERAFSRLSDGQQLPATDHCPVTDNQQVAAACIFFENNYKSMMMFFWDNGSIWVHSVPGRPALDIAAAVLFGFGYIFLLVRYIHKRRWQDLFLLVSVPLLLMPSTLSIAFPSENPSLNRSGGALITVFVIAGVALDGLYTSLRGERSGAFRRSIALLTVVFLLSMSTVQSYDLLFNKFDRQFRAGAWNTSDMGRVIKAFMIAGNSPDNAWVVPYPYWVDTRLAGIQSGLPTKDFALQLMPDDNEHNHIVEALTANTLSVKGPKLFIVKDEDTKTLDALHQVYPNGITGKFDSPLEGKDFWIYTVPDSQGTTP